MPWLISKGDAEKANAAAATDGGEDGAGIVRPLLFVHVPRCGGTSLTKHFKVAERSREGRSLYHKLGLLYFFYRYRLLESANYPWKTFENCWALTLILTATCLFAFLPADPNARLTSYTMWSNATVTMVCSTFFAVAPVVGRNNTCRRLYAFLIGRLMLGFGSSKEWLTGCNQSGWLLHLTAEKILRYKLVEQAAFDEAENFAIVRNPYSRMVSIYSYNRMGPLEPFGKFVEDWYEFLQPYRDAGHSTEERDVYCHALPAHEYTHDKAGKQLVQCVIKQEQLRNLKKKEPNPQFDLLPAGVLKALKDMPHTNSRKRPKPWQEFYTEETRDKVLQMYARDFKVFGYDTAIPKRPELGRPALPEEDHEWESPPDYVAMINKSLPDPTVADNQLLLGEVEPIEAPRYRARTCTVVGEDPEVAEMFEDKSACKTVLDWVKDTFFVHIHFVPPLHHATTVEDLQMLTAVTFRRRCIWLFIFVVAQALVVGVRSGSLYKDCKFDQDSCLALSGISISLSFTTLMFIVGTVAYIEFNHTVLAMAAVWSALSCIWQFTFAGFTTFARVSGRRPDYNNWLNRNTGLAYVIAVYYVFYAVLFARAAHACKTIENRKNEPEETELCEKTVSDSEKPTAYLI